jgi:Cd2+/Zn2+-exporting ATPase
MSATTVPLPEAMRRRLALVFISSALLLAGGLLPLLRPGQDSIGGALALVGMLVIALPIIVQVFTALRATGFAATQFYMDQYVALAMGACLATGQYLTGGIVAVVLVLGQMLEERTVIGVEYALARLRELGAVKATRLDPITAAETTVGAQDLAPGNRIRLRPGDAVPADARVLTGEALLNQANLTGESLPAEVRPGDKIFAGTVNLNGLLEAEVLTAGDGTVMSRVTKILEEAKSAESPIISMAEDYARHYTPLVLLIAASVFFFTQDINRAIAVLIVSIPCAFVLASPSALVSAIACASRLGLLVKGARHFESGRRIDTVVFDKTGTLTQGILHVAHTWIHDPAHTPATALHLAAALEHNSKHPVAQAIHRAASETDRSISNPKSEILNLTETAGLGVTATFDGRTVRVGRLRWLAETHHIPLASLPAEADTHSLVGLALDGVHLATFGLADRLRPEAPEAIARLRAIGITRFVMLTGDRRAVAQRVATQLGLTEFVAECLPEDKKRHIETLKASGARVMVVGDGLNDAPALAAGDLGVAMGALGNEVAIATADVALMSHDLRRLADLLILSRRTIGTINQNLLAGFVLIIGAVTASALGLITPILAAFWHEFSAFFVIFNSARLLRFDGLVDPTEPALAPPPTANPTATPAPALA